MKQRGHRRKVMLIVPYCRTLALSFHGCVHHSTAGLQTSTCRSSMQHMYPWCAVCGQLHLKLHRGLLLWEACCVLTPHKNLDLRPPLFTCWFEHGQIFFSFSLSLFFVVWPRWIHPAEVSLSNTLPWCWLVAACGEKERCSERGSHLFIIIYYEGIKECINERPPCFFPLIRDVKGPLRLICLKLCLFLQSLSSASVWNRQLLPL